MENKKSINNMDYLLVGDYYIPDINPFCSSPLLIIYTPLRKSQMRLHLAFSIDISHTKNPSEKFISFFRWIFLQLII